MDNQPNKPNILKTAAFYIGVAVFWFLFTWIMGTSFREALLNAAVMLGVWLLSKVIFRITKGSVRTSLMWFTIVVIGLSILSATRWPHVILVQFSNVILGWSFGFFLPAWPDFRKKIFK